MTNAISELCGTALMLFMGALVLEWLGFGGFAAGFNIAACGIGLGGIVVTIIALMAWLSRGVARLLRASVGA